MPCLFVPAEQLAGERLALAGDSYRHLIKVLRLKVGDEVLLFDGQGTQIEARLLAVGARTAELALGRRNTVGRPPRAPITLLQVVPRGERMDFIVQKTTELGVSCLVPVVSERSVVKPPAERRRRWEKIAQEAARQCGRADVPEVAEPVHFAAAIARPGLGDAARFVLWEGERELSLRRALTGSERAFALLVGPEGGLSPDEVRAAVAYGFATAGLGPRILRVETAAIAALTLVQAAAGGLE